MMKSRRCRRIAWYRQPCSSSAVKPYYVQDIVQEDTRAIYFLKLMPFDGTQTYICDVR